MASASAPSSPYSNPKIEGIQWSNNCEHGNPSPPPDGHVIYEAWGFLLANRSMDGILRVAEVFDRYPQLANDPKMRTTLKSSMLSIGVEQLLDTKEDTLHQCLFWASNILIIECFYDTPNNKLEKWMAPKYANQFADLLNDGRRNITPFFTKRFFAKTIPCACLDRKYKKTKQQIKMRTMQLRFIVVAVAIAVAVIFTVIG